MFAGFLFPVLLPQVFSGIILVLFLALRPLKA
jgi:hypothetical protein